MNTCIARLKIYNLSELQSEHSQSCGGGHRQSAVTIAKDSRYNTCGENLQS